MRSLLPVPGGVALPPCTHQGILPCQAKPGDQDVHQKGSASLAVAYGEHTPEAHRLYTNLTRKSDDVDNAVPEFQRYWGATSLIQARPTAPSPRQVMLLALALIVCEWASTTSRTTCHPGTRSALPQRAHRVGYKPFDVERPILAQPESTQPETSHNVEPADTAEAGETAEDDDTARPAPEPAEAGDSSERGEGR